MWVRRFGRTVLGILHPGPLAEVLGLPALDLGGELVKLWPVAVLDASGVWKVFGNPAVKVHVPEGCQVEFRSAKKIEIPRVSADWQWNTTRTVCQPSRTQPRGRGGPVEPDQCVHEYPSRFAWSSSGCQATRRSLGRRILRPMCALLMPC